jgi:cytidine deaminase
LSLGYFTWQGTSVDDQELIRLAQAARKRAYAPYSNYRVGAALLTAAGQVFTGCNVENAVYPLCTCAERTAVVKAVSEGQREFVAIAIATRNGGSPCGSCRQVLREFAPHLRVLLANEAGAVRERTLDQLLPDSFGPESLA